MTQTPVKADSNGADVETLGAPQVTYLEWVSGEIRTSPWYVGDGGFVAQAMSANTLEEATATGDLVSGRDRAGDVFKFLSATFADSDLEGALPFYAVCDVVDAATGEAVKWSCGGTRIVATLFRAAQMGWFPFDASVASIDLGSGMHALNLVLAPDKATAAPKK